MVRLFLKVDFLMVAKKSTLEKSLRKNVKENPEFPLLSHFWTIIFCIDLQGRPLLKHIYLCLAASLSCFVICIELIFAKLVLPHAIARVFTIVIHSFSYFQLR